MTIVVDDQLSNENIAILGTHGIPARYGGFETFAEEIAVRLAEEGVRVTVYCQSASRNAVGHYRGVLLVRLSAPNLGPLTTLLFDLKCLWHARKRFDIVYMLGYGASIFCFIPRLFGKSVWINMDGVEWARSKWSIPARIWLRCMEALAMRTPNRIIADANGIKSHLQQRYSRMPACSVISYGAPLVYSANIRLLRHWDLRPNDYYLVVCRLEPENHLLEILKGFSNSSTNRKLIIVGNDSSGTDYVKRLLRERDIRVRFVGTVFDPAELQSLRFFCYAYFHGHSVGGTNPSLLEAMGCGNAVIAHDNVYNREVSDDAGLYFNSWSDIPHLIDIIEHGHSEIKLMRSNAHRIIKERYTWEQVTSSYLSLLNSIR